MKPVSDFVAERRVVQHCDELLRANQTPFDIAAACTEFAAELALALPGRLETLLLGPKIVISDWPVETVTASALEASWFAPSIHFAITLGPALPRFVVSFDNALALALTDRLFGGRGGVPEEAPRALPQSATLAVEQLVRCLGETLGAMCGADGSQISLACHPVLHRLGVMPRNPRCLRWNLTVEQVGTDPWNISLAVEEGAMRPLLEPRCGGSPHGKRRAADPLSPAMAEIPLTLSATLAKIRLPLDRLATLQPGTTIPFAPRREVPLAIGGQTVATATVGALDERVALRLIRLS